jgi:hypothetical protein
VGKHGKEYQESPHGDGPHPSPEESQQEADQFDEQYEASRSAGDEKNANGTWRG